MSESDEDLKQRIETEQKVSKTEIQKYEKQYKKEVAELGNFTNIIPVTEDECFSGICNSVRLPNQVLNSSHIHDLKVGTEDYRYELQKNRRLEDISANLAMEVAYFNLSEFHKSGALLSCMVMHLNRHSYKIALTA